MLGDGIGWQRTEILSKQIKLLKILVPAPATLAHFFSFEGTLQLFPGAQSDWDDLTYLCTVDL